MRSIGFIGAILLVCLVCFSNARNLAKWDAHSMLKSVDKLGKQLKPDDYFAFIPAYVGSVLVGEPLSWEANCFETTTATLDIQQDYAYLYVSTSNKQGLICDDTYLIGNVADFDITYFEIPWNHTISWSLDGYTDAEIFDLKYNGFRVFLFPDSVSGSVEEIFETAMMFFGALLGASVPSWTAEDNVKFLKDHMNYEMKERKTQIVTLNESDIHSGDFLGIIRLDGLDPMLAWAMGSTTGHTAITLWIDGQLYVLESTVDSAYWPRNGVQKTPWKQWLVQAEAASYSVVHLPLSPQYRALFNETAAYEWFQSVEGLPYGFHAQFVGWIDTPEDNFPGVLSSHLVMLLMSFGDWLFRNELNWGPTFDFFAQSMNYRLGTQNLTVNEIYVAMAKQGMNFTDMLTMPELDSYTYLDNNRTGAAMVCDVLVVRLWKASGIFGSITDQIQGGEFTNWDAYSLNIFDSNYVRPSQCVAADPMLPYCQIMGKYRMTLNNYNQFAPYAHMRQTCGGHAPDYVKQTGC